MPMIYGEGDKAFRRLQEQIMKDFDDDSILAWRLDPKGLTPDNSSAAIPGGILAASPSDFANCGQIALRKRPVNDSFGVHGGSLRLYLILHMTSSGETLGLLNCGPEHDTDTVVGVPLAITLAEQPGEYTRPKDRPATLIRQPAPGISAALVRIRVGRARRLPAAAEKEDAPATRPLLGNGGDIGTRDNMAAHFDPYTWYRLTNNFSGRSMALDVRNDGGLNSTGLLMMAPSGYYSGQFWRFIPQSPGVFKLHTMFLGPNRVLDVSGGGKATPHLAREGDFSGQFWTLESWGDGAWKLTNAYTGPELHLDIYPDTYEPCMAEGNCTGQHWHITDINSV
ncbi:hypothetical protein DL771_007612 [Monosporascus sp. 5C6A]|nr:hypothetical protein DL771_007612 [Monosporascus sp. 5C6A]